MSSNLPQELITIHTIFGTEPFHSADIIRICKHSGTNRSPVWFVNRGYIHRLPGKKPSTYILTEKSISRINLAEHPQLIISLHISGKTINEISTLTGLSWGTVRRHIPADLPQTNIESEQR